MRIIFKVVWDARKNHIYCSVRQMIAVQCRVVLCGLLVSLSHSSERLRIPPIGVMMVLWPFQLPPLSVVTVMVIGVMVLLPGESFVFTPVP